jgi:hypothetical protein
LNKTDRQTENESSVGLFGCLFSPRRLPSVSGVPKERKKERKSKTLTKEEEEARRELETSSSSEEKKKERRRRRRRREIQQFHLRWNAHHRSSRCLKHNWRWCGRQQQKRRVAMAGLLCCGYGAFDESRSSSSDNVENER